jgi:hypothetical protein
VMAASAACSNPHVFAHTLRFSARGFLALTKNAWFLEVPLGYCLAPVSTYREPLNPFNLETAVLRPIAVSKLNWKRIHPTSYP